MAEACDYKITVDIPAEGEASDKALLLVTRQVMKRYRRTIRLLAKVLEVEPDKGGRRLSDHQLSEVLLDKAERLMSSNARRMGTLTHQGRAPKKPPTRH